MTCNPNWLQIKKELCFGKTPQDRPDLVARIFHAKLEQLKEELFKKELLSGSAMWFPMYMLLNSKKEAYHMFTF